MVSGVAVPEDHDDSAEAIDTDESFIPLSDPDITSAELHAVEALLCSPRISKGPITDAFEKGFAAYIGRKYAVAVPSGTIGLLLALKALGIGPGQEVIASAYSFRETVHAIVLLGARTVFADVHYWSGALVPAKVEERITANTRAIIAGNPNGHPAPWSELRAIAQRHQLPLVEDSTEAIGSRYKGELVGRFGDIAVFDFAQPLALTCGEGGMVVTDDIDMAVGLRRHRAHRLDERSSAVVSSAAPYQVGMSDLTAALGLAQLKRVDEIIERRRLTEQLYNAHMQSLGIQPSYVGPDVTEVNWFLYLVHLGTRFTRSSRDAVIDDLRIKQVEAAAYCHPLHLQRHYFDLGYRQGDFLVTENIADRAVALPFHAHLTENQIEFIVETMKRASINISAGAAIY